MAETVDLEKANKITIELLVHGYLRLHILSDSKSSDIPLKVFNTLLSQIICNDIATCSILSICLKILKDYDKWVNIEKQPKELFLCNIPIENNDINNKYWTPSQIMEIYFDHISNLHGLTYCDYDILHKYCIQKMYNHHNSFNLHGSNVSILNECLSIDCLILSDEQRKKLESLRFGEAASNESIDLSLENATNTLLLEREDTYDSKEMQDTEEAEDTFPTMGLMGNSNSFIGGTNAMYNSNVTSLLTPNWRGSTSHLSIRSKWQNHVATVSSTSVSGMISQLSILDILPQSSDDLEDDDDDDGNNINSIKNGLDIVLPSPTTSNIASISVKSYKFLFDNINTKTMDDGTEDIDNNNNNNNNNNNIGVRELNQMEISPFDLLPDQTIEDEHDDDDDDNDDIDNNKNGKRKSRKIRKSQRVKNFEYEFRTKLSDILHEMDLMDEGKLDLADFSTALMSVAKNNDDYDFLSISMKIFDDDNGLNKDDMDSAKIDDIITWIIINIDDDIINLKKMICNGLKIEYNDINNDNNMDIEDEEDHNKENEFEGLKLAEKEKSDEPYKPIYQITSGIQRFGNNKKTTEKKKEIKENKNDDNIKDLPSLTITKSISDEGVSNVLDKIHIYLFHSVHDIKQIPL